MCVDGTSLSCVGPLVIVVTIVPGGCSGEAAQQQAGCNPGLAFQFHCRLQQTSKQGKSYCLTPVSLPSNALNCLKGLPIKYSLSGFQDQGGPEEDHLCSD